MSDAAQILKATIARGKQRFFERHPELLDEVDGMKGSGMGASGADADAAQEIARYRVMARAAKANKIDTIVMLLELGSNSEQEFDQLLALQGSKMSKAFGL